jgi:hypothetical protein
MRSQLLAAFISGAVSDDWPRPCFLFDLSGDGIYHERLPSCGLGIDGASGALQLGAFHIFVCRGAVLVDGQRYLFRYWMGHFERALIRC